MASLVCTEAAPAPGGTLLSTGILVLPILPTCHLGRTLVSRTPFCPTPDQPLGRNMSPRGIGHSCLAGAPRKFSGPAGQRLPWPGPADGSGRRERTQPAGAARTWHASGGQGVGQGHAGLRHPVALQQRVACDALPLLQHRQGQGGRPRDHQPSSTTQAALASRRRPLSGGKNQTRSAVCVQHQYPHARAHDKNASRDYTVTLFF